MKIVEAFSARPQPNIDTSKGGYYVDRDGNISLEVTLRPAEWAIYTSKNGTQYSVFNVRGRIVTTKVGSISNVKPIKDILNTCKVLDN